jgi:ribosomal protein S6--L-glutamate ligase
MKVNVYDTLRLSTLIGTENKILYRQVELKHPDVVIPRIGATITSFGGSIMFQMEKMKIPLLNSSEGMFNSRDKFRSGQILAAEGLPIPKTMVLRRPSKKDLGKIDSMQHKVLLKHRVQQAIEMLGGPSVIVKLNKGTQGVGVILCASPNEAYAQVEMLWKSGAEFIIQEFIAESKGMDIRALVVGDKVVGSMKRESKTGDFRSNTHQGGEASAYTLPEEFQQIAVRAAKVLGLNVAGVDMLKTKDGFKIVEVNSSPGFEGLEKCTGLNIAGSIMEFAKAMGKPKKRNSKLFMIPHISEELTQ